jgi:hypothetical protein
MKTRPRRRGQQGNRTVRWKYRWRPTFQKVTVTGMPLESLTVSANLNIVILRVVIDSTLESIKASRSGRVGTVGAQRNELGICTLQGYGYVYGYGCGCGYGTVWTLGPQENEQVHQCGCAIVGTGICMGMGTGMGDSQRDGMRGR